MIVLSRSALPCLLVLAAGCLCGSGAAGAAPGLRLADAGDLVVNGAFQDGPSGWDQHLYNATIGGSGAGVHDSGYVGQDVPVTKGLTYTFSARAGAADQGAVLVLALDSRSGVGYVNRTVTSTAPETVTQTFTAAGDTVYIACQATGATGGWCTDFSVVAAPAAAGSCTGSATSGSGCTLSAATGSAQRTRADG
ncbi:hypothetical protein BJY24_000962 [Nocardia transvalensis]|uniref:CBM-cenC domain-containing protein n=1 Tax=Nocardia transvalensis TaxID=37333 RepID=A0A7W9P9V8_9NOCA|nr:hypothetical protein [Nocardia transvalensis]MBB5912095.1 hypothetical protein [Nocardia transvalensis]